MRWTHGHTFAGGLAAGLFLAVHLWLLLAIATAAIAIGGVLGVGLARGVWALSGRLAARWGSGPTSAERFASVIPPDAEVHVIAKPRTSRYDRPSRRF